MTRYISGFSSCLYFALECRDGELQAVVLVLAEGIVLARGEPLRDHLDVLERSVLVVVFVDLCGNRGRALLVLGGTDDGEGFLLAFRDEFRDDVEHGIILSMYVDSGTKKALAEASASDFKW